MLYLSDLSGLIDAFRMVWSITSGNVSMLLSPTSIEELTAD